MTALELRLLNAKFSPNLGDGLLVECLEWGCRQQLSHAVASSIDLAGRTAYAEGPRLRAALLATLTRLPDRMRRAAVDAALRTAVRRRLLPFYRERLWGADAVIVGGGNLLSDVDLNFPTKLAAALSVASEAGVPVWIYGCGVGERWSAAGHALFEHALRGTRLIDVFLRDEASKRAWDERLGQATGILGKVVPDPGLLAAHVYGVPRCGPPDRRLRLGVGVIAPVAIGYHGGTPTRASELSAWLSALIAGAIAAGHAVSLVSNGSPEDTAFARALLARLRQRFPASALELPRHRAPCDLVHTVAGVSRFVGFRLHGLICARSLGVPTFALRWDHKVDAFMQAIGRADRCYDVARVRPEQVLARMLGERVSDDRPPAADALAGIAALCSSISATLRRESRGAHARDPMNERLPIGAARA